MAEGLNDTGMVEQDTKRGKPEKKEAVRTFLGHN